MIGIKTYGMPATLGLPLALACLLAPSLAVAVDIPARRTTATNDSTLNTTHPTIATQADQGYLDYVQGAANTNIVLDNGSSTGRWLIVASMQTSSGHCQSPRMDLYVNGSLAETIAQSGGCYYNVDKVYGSTVRTIPAGVNRIRVNMTNTGGTMGSQVVRAVKIQ